jgi:hypothetical protein
LIPLVHSLVQQKAIFDPTLYAQQRTYILCKGTIVIGTVAPGGLAPVGGDFPLVVVNPNVHILCEEPQTCIFSGGALHIRTYDNNDIVQAFLASQGLPLPPGYVTDSSNLLVEGVTFTGVTAPSSGVVQFSGPGENMKFSNCLFTAQDSQNPPNAAFYMLYYGTRGTPIGQEFYTSTILEDCVIENNDIGFAIFNSYWVGNKPDKMVHSVDLIRTSIKNNRLPGFIGTTPFFGSAFINGFFFKLSFYDSEMVDNVNGRSAANIRLLDGELGAFENSVINNVITEDLYPDCQDIVLGTTSLDYISPDCGLTSTCPNVPFNVTGCIEVNTPAPTPFPVVAPTPFPVLPPTDFSLGGGSGGMKMTMGKTKGKGMGKRGRELSGPTTLIRGMEAHD